MRNTTRFGVETSGRQNLFGRSVRDWAVTEIPDAGDHNGGAIVAVGMCSDLGVCRNAQADCVRAVLGWVPCHHGGTNSGDPPSTCARTVPPPPVDLPPRD